MIKKWLQSLKVSALGLAAIITAAGLFAVFDTKPASAALVSGKCIIKMDELNATYYRKKCGDNAAADNTVKLSRDKTTAGSGKFLTQVSFKGERPNPDGGTLAYTWENNKTTIDWCTYTWGGNWNCTFTSHGSTKDIKVYTKEEVEQETRKEQESAGDANIGKVLASSIPSDIKNAFKNKQCSGVSGSDKALCERNIDIAWHKKLGECDTNAKSAAATWERRGSEGWQASAAEAYRGNFALCLANATGLVEADIKAKLPEDLYSKRNQAQQEGRDSVDDPLATPVGEEENPTSCDIEGIGWIICPVAETIASATDALYGWISNFLVVQPLNMNTGANDNTTYIAWKNMRNIANVAFVIAFLIIIFSQLTSSGISNYGVKKMLPRLVIAAILVNLSYWITAIAVDLSNIIGNNIYNLLRNLDLGSITFEANIWESLMVWLLSAGAIGGGVVAFSAVAAAGTGGALFTALLWGALVVLLMAFLSLLVAFAILALRQALIIILIILSPLAFVAFLLPNTEKFFGLWRRSLTTLLVFYPLFSILFGGAYVASLAIIGSAGQASGDGMGGQPAAVGMMVILGLAVQVIPLALTPLLIKFSTGIMGQVAGMVNNKSRGLIDRARNVRDRKSSLAMNETLASQRNAKNPFGRLYRRAQNSKRIDASRQRIIEGANTSAYTDAILDPNSKVASQASGIAQGTSLVQASALAAKNKEDNEEIHAEKLLITSQGGDINAILQDKKASTARRVAAASLIAERGSDSDIRNALDYAGGNELKSQAAKASIQQQLASDLGARKPISLGAGSMSQLKTGDYSGTVTEKATERLSGGKISADTLAKASADELNEMKSSIQAAVQSGDPSARKSIEELRSSIAKRLENPNVEQPSAEVARAMQALHDTAGKELGISPLIIPRS